VLAEAFVPIVTIDIMAIIFILKDEKYFFDNEKSWLVLLVILLPIVGVLYHSIFVLKFLESWGNYCK
jgi:hypothetical protein